MRTFELEKAVQYSNARLIAEAPATHPSWEVVNCLVFLENGRAFIKEVVKDGIMRPVHETTMIMSMSAARTSANSNALRAAMIPKKPS